MKSDLSPLALENEGFVLNAGLLQHTAHTLNPGPVPSLATQHSSFLINPNWLPHRTKKVKGDFVSKNPNLSNGNLQFWEASGCRDPVTGVLIEGRLFPRVKEVLFCSASFHFLTVPSYSFEAAGINAFPSLKAGLIPG